MTPDEVRVQTLRIEQFRALEQRERQILGALADMEEPKIQGSGPFTGNTRETRRVINMRIDFSETRGKAPEISISLDSLHIEARELGDWIREKLTAQIKAIREERAKL